VLRAEGQLHSCRGGLQVGHMACHLHQLAPLLRQLQCADVLLFTCILPALCCCAAAGLGGGLTHQEVSVCWGIGDQTDYLSCLSACLPACLLMQALVTLSCTRRWLFAESAMDEHAQASNQYVHTCLMLCCCRLRWWFDAPGGGCHPWRHGPHQQNSTVRHDTHRQGALRIGNRS
jgi:hypothetical protein